MNLQVKETKKAMCTGMAVGEFASLMGHGLLQKDW